MAEKEIKITGNMLVPVNWLFAILGSGLMSAFCIGVWVSSISSKVNGQEEKISGLSTAQVQTDNKVTNLSNNIIRIDTILTYAFPDEAKRAPARAEP